MRNNTDFSIANARREAAPDRVKLFEVHLDRRTVYVSAVQMENALVDGQFHVTFHVGNKQVGWFVNPAGVSTQEETDGRA